MKKSEQLGMSFQTARGRLIKSLLFELLKEAKKNFCYRCGEEIININDLSLDHKIDWIGSENPIETFSSTENIGYSHLLCNTKARRRTGIKHPSHRAYNEGCRCDECRAVEAERKRRQRKKDKE